MVDGGNFTQQLAAPGAALWGDFLLSLCVGERVLSGWLVGVFLLGPLPWGDDGLALGGANTNPNNRMKVLFYLP